MSEIPANPDLQALRDLVKTSPQDALPQAVQLLTHEDWNVRRSGAEILGDLGSTGIQFLKDTIEKENDPTEKQNLCHWATIAAFDFDLDDIPTLRFLYKHGENHIKRGIMERMRPDSKAGDLEFLFEALGERSWDVREKASKVFIRKGAGVVDFLEGKFPDANPDQRFWTFKIFAILLGSTATPYFSKFLKQDPHNEQLQVFAVSNLGEINDARVIKTLLNLNLKIKTMI